MQFDSLSKLKIPTASLSGAAQTIAKAGVEKSQEVLAEINLLLQLLQTAGYGVASLDIELNIPPKATVKLKTSAAVKEDKLNDILSQGQQGLITVVVASLIQANKLRGSITVQTLELEGIEIMLTTVPNITLQWKDKGDRKGMPEAAA
jgi:Flp pilus assembly protein TadG